MSIFCGAVLIGSTSTRDIAEQRRTEKDSVPYLKTGDNRGDRVEVAGRSAGPIEPRLCSRHWYDGRPSAQSRNWTFRSAPTSSRKYGRRILASSRPRSSSSSRSGTRGESRLLLPGRGGTRWLSWRSSLALLVGENMPVPAYLSAT